MGDSGSSRWLIDRLSRSAPQLHPTRFLPLGFCPFWSSQQNVCSIFDNRSSFSLDPVLIFHLSSCLTLPLVHNIIPVTVSHAKPHTSNQPITTHRNPGLVRPVEFIRGTNIKGGFIASFESNAHAFPNRILREKDIGFFSRGCTSIHCLLDGLYWTHQPWQESKRELFCTLFFPFPHCKPA
jgi:hypothetical protein